MKTPHKHAELIKAWADGAEIEHKYFKTDIWCSTSTLLWDNDGEYRIKPEPKPDVVRYGLAWPLVWDCELMRNDNLKLTFDGETGKLKSAEVIS
jgi:hypothetical protein